MSGHNFLEQWRDANWAQPDPGSTGFFNSDECTYYPMVLSASAETATLRAPTRAGLLCTLSVDTAGGGTRTVTVTGGYNVDADTDIAFVDARDMAMFFSIKVGTAFRWALIHQEGTTATIENLTVDTLTAATAAITTLTATDETVTNSTIAALTATLLNLAVTSTNATGTAIGNATALAAGLNVIDSADNSKAVILPVATVGQVVMIRSTVADKSLPVFPQVDAAIDALAANSSFAVAAANTGGSATFVAESATQWWTFPSEDDT